MNAQQIVEALGGQNDMACCPAHADKNPSLKVSTQGDKTLVHCYAGCTQEAVIDALRNRGLWPEFAEFEIDHPTRGKPDQSWKYHDSAGQVVSYVNRFNTATGKDVLPYSKQPDGWRWKAPAAPRPIYNLHKLTKHPDARVIITEGEKAADAASKLFPDDVVTTWQGGCKAVAKTGWTPLKGRSVLIWPDADEPGKDAADSVAVILSAQGCSIQRITPPADVVAGWDAADALAEGWTMDQVEALVQEPVDRGLKLLSAAELAERKTVNSWAVDQTVEDDTLTIYFGESDTYKSFLITGMMFSVATGRPWNGRKTKQGAVVAVIGEGLGGYHKRLQGLAQDAGVDLAQIPFYVTDRAAEFGEPASFNRLTDQLDIVAKTQDIKIIAIDTLARCFGGRDENSNQDMSRFILDMDALRNRYKCAVVIIHHVGQGDKQRERGAYALRAALDWRWMIEKTTDDTIKLSCLKPKDHETPPPINLQAEQIQLNGLSDEEGRPVTTLVLREINAPRLSVKPKKLSANNQMALDALRSISIDGTTDLDTWRNEFYARSTADDQETKRRYFGRARTDLVQKGYVSCRYDVYAAVAAERPDNRTTTGQVPDKSGLLSPPGQPDRTGQGSIDPVPCPVTGTQKVKVII